MADLVWYRSLYWRIALGFVALARDAARPAGPGVPVDLRTDGRSVSESDAGAVCRHDRDGSVGRACRAADARRRRVRERALLGRVAGIRRRAVGRPRGRQPACSTAAACCRESRGRGSSTTRIRIVVAAAAFAAAGRTAMAGRDFGGGRSGGPGGPQRAGGRVRVHQRERHGGRDCGRAGRTAAAVDDAARPRDRRWPSSPSACSWSARRSRRWRSSGRHAGA